MPGGRTEGKQPGKEKHRATARDKRITVNTLSRHQNQNGRTDLR